MSISQKKVFSSKSSFILKKIEFWLVKYDYSFSRKIISKVILRTARLNCWQLPSKNSVTKKILINKQMSLKLFELFNFNND